MKHTLLILMTFLAFSCTRKFYIAPKLADCNISGRSQCYLIKSTLEDNWIMIAEDIVGFEFEEGFVYRVLVKKIRLVDDFGTERPAYEIVDVLLKEIYKGKKSNETESSKLQLKDVFPAEILVENNQLSFQDNSTHLIHQTDK